jgi:hypothetical protein
MCQNRLFRPPSKDQDHNPISSPTRISHPFSNFFVCVTFVAFETLMSTDHGTAFLHELCIASWEGERENE